MANNGKHDNQRTNPTKPAQRGDMAGITIAFRPAGLLPRLVERAGSDASSTNLNAVTRRDLERFYAMLPVFLRDVSLPATHLRTLLELYPQAWPEGMSAEVIQLLPAAVTHELREKAETGADRDMIARLEQLNAGQRLALVDALERAVQLVAAGADPEEALRQVKLVS